MDVRSQLRIKKVTTTGGAALVLSGVVDGFLELEHWSVAAPAVVVDLGGVVRVTSFGMRGWVDGLARVKTDYLAFTRCPPAMLDFFGQLAGATGNGEVLSMYLPYECGACMEEFYTLSDVRQDHAQMRKLQAPRAPCPHCAADAAFNAIPRAYFSSIGPEPPVPPSVVDELARRASMISEGETATATSLKAAREQMESMGAALDKLSRGARSK
jgi:hypothetical protein